MVAFSSEHTYDSIVYKPVGDSVKKLHRIKKRTRRLVSKAEDLLSFAVESVDFSALYAGVKV